MSDVRELLQEAAPVPGELDLERLRTDGRRRRRRPRRAVAVVAVVALAGTAAALLSTQSERKTRIRVGQTPTTTAVPTPSRPNPTTTDPALSLPPSVPRCRAEDLELLDSQRVPLPSAAGLLLRFKNRNAQDCALVSYPTLFGRRDDGKWAEIPSRPIDLDPVSSFLWTGLVASKAFAPTNGGPPPPTVVRIDVVLPSAFVGSRCPGPRIRAQHFSGIRLELRGGAGMIELDDTPLDVSGCEIQITHFGYDSQDA